MNSKYIVTIKSLLDECLSKTLSRYQYKYLYNQLRYQFKKYNTLVGISIKHLAYYGVWIFNPKGFYIYIDYYSLKRPIRLDVRYCKESILTY